VALAAASLVAAIALAPVLASATASYLDLDSVAATVKNGKMTATFDTQDTVPKAVNARGLAFGYGIVTKVTEGTTLPAEAIVATTHAGVLDSQKQVTADNAVWHNHYVTLVGADASVCASTIQVGEITWESPGATNVFLDKVVIQNAPLDFDGTSSLSHEAVSYSGGTPLVGASFTLTPVFDSNDNLTNVCVTPVDFPHGLSE